MFMEWKKLFKDFDCDMIYYMRPTGNICISNPHYRIYNTNATNKTRVFGGYNYHNKAEE